MRALPCDYDTDPARGRSFLSPAGEDVHARVARRIGIERRHPVVDVGCGTGRLAAAPPRDWPWIGVERSPSQLASAPSTTIRADASSLPLPTGSAGAVAALWVLYHLDDPVEAVEESWRVLRRGRVFVTCTTARDDSPESLAPRAPTTFDAEDAPDRVDRVFPDLEVRRWDAPLRRSRTPER